MPDNVELNTGSGGDTLRAEDRTTYKTPVSLIDVGGVTSEAILGDASVVFPLANTVKDASGTFYAPLVDADGHLQVDVLSAASTAVTNAGVFAVQVDGAALTALQLLDDAVYTDATGTPSKGLAVMGTDGTNPQLLSCGTDGVLDVDIASSVALDVSAATVTVTGTITANLGATDNAVLDSIDAAVNGTLTVDGSGVTQPVSGTTRTEYSEDAATPATIVGSAVMMERDDALSAVTPIEGDWIGLRGDANGALWTVVNGTVTVDGSGVTQPVSGTVTANLSATDNAVLDSIDAAVNGTLTVGSHAVTNAGTFAVQVDGDALTALQLIDDAVYADDAAFTLASSKVLGMGAIRDDSLTTLTAVEGDVVPLRVGSTGALHVTGAGGGTQYQVDDAAGATDTGTLALAIRDDALTTLTPADGDYVGLRVSSTGALHVTGGGGGTEYNEDDATPATIIGTASLMERDDALTTVTPIEGDWLGMRGTAEGALWVQDFNSDAILTDTGTIAGDTTSIDGKITACDTGAVVLASGTVTTVSTVTNLSQLGGAAVSMNTGTRDAGTQRVTIATDDSVPVTGTVTANPAATISSNNSTTTPLGISGTFVGTGDDCDGFATVTITLYADQASAADGMTFQFSTDNSNWDDTYSFTMAAGETRRFQFPVTAQYFRVNYTNGGTGQGAFRVQTILHRSNLLTSIHRVEDNVSTDRSAQLVKAVLVAQTNGSGDFIPVQGTGSGILKIGGTVEVDTWSAGTLVVDGSAVTQPVSAASLPLPTGAATEATLGTIDTDTGNIAAGYATEGSALGSGVLIQGDDGTDRTNVLVDTDGHLQVDVLSGGGGGTQYAVDDALGATPTGTLAVGIRDDALSALTPVEGDAVGLRVDANGALWTIPSGTVTVDGSGVTQPISAASLPLPTGAATEATLATIDSSASSILADTSTIAAGIAAVDDALGATPSGMLSLAIRDDALSALTPVEGDAVGLRVDANGALWTIPSGTVTVDNGGTFAVQSTLQTGSATIGKLAANSGVDIGDVDVTSQPARDRLTDNIGVALQTDAILSDTTALTPKFAVIDDASSGDNTIVAAVAGKKIRVLACWLVASAAVTCRFEDGAAGTALTGQMQLAANGGFVLPFNPVGWFETSSNTLLNLELSGAISVDGNLVYVEV